MKNKYKVGDILYSFYYFPYNNRKFSILEVKIIKNHDDIENNKCYRCSENIDGKFETNTWRTFQEHELYENRKDAVNSAITSFKNRINEIELEKKNLEKLIKLCV